MSENIALCPKNITLTIEDEPFLKSFTVKHNTNVSLVIEEYVKILRDKETL